MPKAILEFNLPEEQEDFELANKGALAHLLLNEFDNHLRNIVKYHDSEENINKVDFTQEIRDKLRELARHHHIDI